MLRLAINIRVAKQPCDVTFMQKIGSTSNAARVVGWNAIIELPSAVKSWLIPTLPVKGRDSVLWCTSMQQGHEAWSRMWCNVKKLQRDQRINTLETITKVLILNQYDTHDPKDRMYGQCCWKYCFENQHVSCNHIAWRFWRLEACSHHWEKRLLATSCLSLCPHVTARLQLGGFPLSLIFEYFSLKVYREN